MSSGPSSLGRDEPGRLLSLAEAACWLDVSHMALRDTLRAGSVVPLAGRRGGRALRLVRVGDLVRLDPRAADLPLPPMEEETVVCGDEPPLGGSLLPAGTRGKPVPRSQPAETRRGPRVAPPRPSEAPSIPERVPDSPEADLGEGYLRRQLDQARADVAAARDRNSRLREELVTSGDSVRQWLDCATSTSGQPDPSSAALSGEATTAGARPSQEGGRRPRSLGWALGLVLIGGGLVGAVGLVGGGWGGDSEEADPGETVAMGTASGPVEHPVEESLPQAAPEETGPYGLADANGDPPQVDPVEEEGSGSGPAASDSKPEPQQRTVPAPTVADPPAEDEGTSAIGLAPDPSPEPGAAPPPTATPGPAPEDDAPEIAPSPVSPVSPDEEPSKAAALPVAVSGKPESATKGVPCRYYPLTRPGTEGRALLGPCQGAWDSGLEAVRATHRSGPLGTCRHHHVFLTTLEGSLDRARDQARVARAEGMLPPLLRLRVDRAASALLREQVPVWVESGFESGLLGEGHRVESLPDGGRWRVLSWVRYLDFAGVELRRTFTMTLALGDGPRGDSLLQLSWDGE